MKLPADVMESPFFQIEVDGVLIPESVSKQVKSVEYSSPDIGADSVTIITADKDYYFLNNPRLFEDLPVTVSIGYVGATPVVFRGYVASVTPRFPSSGVPQITIFCLDQSHLLNKRKRTRTWSNVKVSDVLKTIAREYGLSADVIETSEVYDQLSQVRETDMQFMTRIVQAEHNKIVVESLANSPNVVKEMGYIFKVTNGKMTLRKRVFSGDPRRELWYNSGDCNLRSFDPTFVTNAYSPEIENSGNTSGGKTTSGDVDPTTGEVVPDNGPKQVKVYEHTPGVWKTMTVGGSRKWYGTVPE